MSGRGAFRALLYAGGAVATAAGLDTILRGARSLPGERAVAAPAIESELRYYSAFYVAFGLATLRAAPRADRDPGAVRGIAAALLLAGLARAEAWRSVGRPNPGQIALLAVELGAPLPLVAWQSRLG